MDTNGILKYFPEDFQSTISFFKRIPRFKRTLAVASLGLVLTSGCATNVSASAYAEASTPKEKASVVSTSSKENSSPPIADSIELEKKLQRDMAKFVRENPYDIKSVKVPVIMYHRFMKNDANVKYPDLEVTTEEFKRGLINLKKEGYSVISLETLYEFMVNGKFIPQKSVVLTFDDGWEIPDEIINTLQELGFTANDAIISSSTSASSKNSNKNSWSYLSWDEINELIKKGVIIPENHTVDHPFLSRTSNDKSKREIEDADSSILEHTNVKTQALVLPYGDGEGNKRIINQAKNAGEKMIVTTDNGLNRYGDDPMKIKRYSAVHGLDLAAQVNSLLEK